MNARKPVVASVPHMSALVTTLVTSQPAPPGSAPRHAAAAGGAPVMPRAAPAAVPCWVGTLVANAAVTG
eukprot:gene7618-4382_t